MWESYDPGRVFLCFTGEESDCLKRLNGPGYPFVNKYSQKGIAQPGRLCLPHGSREKYGQKKDNTGFFGDMATVLPPSVHVGNHMGAVSGPEETSLLFYCTEDLKMVRAPHNSSLRKETVTRQGRRPVETLTISPRHADLGPINRSFGSYTLPVSEVNLNYRR